jgi:hypothetical protein
MKHEVHYSRDPLVGLGLDQKRTREISVVQFTKSENVASAALCFAVLCRFKPA